MISQRKKEEREARKERIMLAALKVYHDKGLEATNMEEIATVAGFGRASLYYYFPSKEDIFSYIFEQGWIRLWDAIEESLQIPGPPSDRFMALLNKINSVAMADRALYSFLFSAPKVLSNIPINEQTWKPYQERLYAVFQSLINEGIAAGDFPDIDSDILMRAIGGLFHGLLFLGDGNRSLEESDISDLVSKLLKTSGNDSISSH